MEHKHHLISLYALITILLISQIFTMSMLVLRTAQLNKQINDTQVMLNSEISKNQMETLSKINNLADSLTRTQSDVNKQLSEIKATTSSDFSGIIELAVKSVVTIKTNSGLGTGFLITNNGYIITNAHVLADSSGHLAENIRAVTYDQGTIGADFIGFDGNLDIALLKIPGNYQAIELGNSNNVKVGEKVIAIGNPFGLSFSATEGIISAVNRVGINNLPYYIQTDAALNPGNSGGPLIDKTGEVIGINNFKATGENIGFALESNYIKSSVNNIAQQALNITIV